MKSFICVYGLLVNLIHFEILKCSAETRTASDSFINEQVVVVAENFSEMTSRNSRSIRDSGKNLRFSAFHRDFNVTLGPWAELISPNFAVTFRNQIGTNAILDDLAIRPDCLYRGSVDISGRESGGRVTDQAAVAFDICHGYRGVIISEAGGFFYVLEPLLNRTEENLHVIKRVAAAAALRSAVKATGDPLTREQPFWRKKKKKRNAEEVTIETAVFVDEPLYLHMQSNFPADTELHITHFVLALINAVQLLYQDESLDTRVHFQIQRLEIWSRQPEELHLPHKTRSDIDRYLHRFCRWQNAFNPPDDYNPLHWDHALLLTGLDLYSVGRDGQTSDQIVGLAPVGGMCSSSSSCTINEGRHFESVYVVAHEIGHNLGMRHDGLAAGNDCDSSSFLMSPTLGSGKITWSPCSRRYLMNFLNTPQSSCLRDRSFISRSLEHNVTGLLPGQRFSADQQCILRYGRESLHSSQQSTHDISRDSLCSTLGNRFLRQTEKSLSHPALEGTSCGDSHWCRKGRCVANSQLNSVEDSVNEDFSKSSGTTEWKPATHCASACLYGDDHVMYNGSSGIVNLYKQCTDMTDPRKNCAGVGVGYRTCNAMQICRTAKPMTIQQYSNDICARAALLDSLLLPQAAPQQRNDLSRSCQIWCYQRSGGLFSNGWHLPDGTVCSNGNSYSQSKYFCVSGICQEFSCHEAATYQLDSVWCKRLPVFTKAKPGSHHLKFHKFSKAQHWDRSSYATSWPSQIMENGITVYEASPHTMDFLQVPKESKSGPSPGHWSSWISASSCRSGCLSNSRGLRLVVRTCSSESCPGKNSSIQLCTPQTNDCTDSISTDDFASRICAQAAWSNITLSGTGTQILDSSAPCSVHCLQRHVHVFVRIDGEKGWFPSGTQCHRTKNSFCVSGRCQEFDADDGIQRD